MNESKPLGRDTFSSLSFVIRASSFFPQRGEFLRLYPGKIRVYPTQKNHGNDPANPKPTTLNRKQNVLKLICNSLVSAPTLWDTKGQCRTPDDANAFIIN